MYFKYFENTDPYAKLIFIPPEVEKTYRTVTVDTSSISSAIKQRIRNLKNGGPTTIPGIKLTGKEILEYVANDNPYLQQYNPIVGLLHYGGGVFQKVKDDDEFFLPQSTSSKDAELLCFHVQRDIPVDQLRVQSTLLFSSVQGAFQWLHQAKSKIGVNFQIRVFHPKYLGFFTICDMKGNFVKIEDSVLSFGTLKLMLESVVNEEERKNVLDAWKGANLRHSQEELGEDDDDTIDGDFEVINWDEYKTSFLQEKGYSHFADYELTYKNSYHSTDEFKRKEITRAKNWANVIIPQSPKYVSRRMKFMIRRGIPEASRRDVWLGVTGGKSFLRHDPQQYERMFKKLFANYNLNNSEVVCSEVNPRLYPEFGGKLYLDSKHGCYLNDAGKSAAKRVLCVLGEMQKDVDCCPAIPDLVQALLLVMNEHDAFSCIHAMVTISKQTQWYFRTSRMQHALYVESFSGLINNIVPEVGNHFSNIKYDMSKLAYEWFTRSFFSFFPLHILFRLLDGFMYEGSKVMYRAGFAVLKLLSKQILKCRSPEYITKLICEKMMQLQEDELFQTIYNLGLRRKHMLNMDKKSRDSVSSMYKIRGRVTSYVKPKIMCESKIIQNQVQWDQIFSWIPYRQRLKELHCLFSTEKDGYSMHTLINKCKDSGSIIILIQAQPFDEFASPLPQSPEEEDDIVELIKRKRREGKSLWKELRDSKQASSSKTTNSVSRKSSTDSSPKSPQSQVCIFGVYCGEPPEITHRYSGTTETFIFSLYPVEAAYKWTRKNDFFVLGKSNSLSFGGGNGVGLHFDEYLREGTTAVSDTFDNDPLCPTERFRILKVEGFYLK